VQQHHVARVHQPPELPEGLRQCLLVHLPVGVAEGVVVAGLPVQQVVDALGDLEEAVVAVEHHPARVDAGAVQVAEQEVQHLGDAAALLGGVDPGLPGASLAVRGGVSPAEWGCAAGGCTA
jgi:hypothetical protein